MPAIALALAALPGVAPRAASYDLADTVRLDWDNDLAGSASDQEERSPTRQTYDAAPSYRSRESAAGRLDWMSGLAVTDGEFGLRASARIAYGDLFEQLGPSPLVVSRYAGAVATAPAATRHVDLEALDAFVHGTFALGGDDRLSLRLGRQTVSWGESLFFPENGIAAGQGPVDATRLQALSAYQPEARFLPVGQAWASWQAGSGLALEAYWQFEYRASRISAIGPYAEPDALLAPADMNLLFGDDTPDIERYVAARTAEPAPLDQLGLAVKWRAGDLDLGLYGERWTAKTPSIILRPPGQSSEYGPGTYDLAYASGIETVGASASFHLGDADVGAELSGRRGMPLVAAAVAALLGVSDRAALPLGDTLHANLVLTYATPPLPLVPGGATWTAEIGANDVLSARHGADLMPGRTRAAAAIRTVFEPQFYQVVPRLDLSLPIGLGYGIAGSSEVDPTMTRTTGDFDLGLVARFDQVWRAGFAFAHYLGRERIPYLPFQPNGAVDPLATGDWVAFTIARTL